MEVLYELLRVKYKCNSEEIKILVPHRLLQFPVDPESRGIEEEENRPADSRGDGKELPVITF